jgi:hypothetical protein
MMDAELMFSVFAFIDLLAQATSESSSAPMRFDGSHYPIVRLARLASATV